MIRKIITRKCIISNEIKDRQKLIRVVLLKSGQIIVDSQIPGRGAYIDPKPKFIKPLLKRKALHKKFKTNVSMKIYEQLISKMQGDNDGR